MLKFRLWITALRVESKNLNVMSLYLGRDDLPATEVIGWF